MSKWLARARSRDEFLARVPNVPNVPKPPSGTYFGNFGNFGTRGGDQNPPESRLRVPHDFAAEVDEAEREAIAIELGGVPELYAPAFARLQAHAPPEMPLERWHHFINDAGIFLDQWGHEAERLGWRSADLFGLVRTAPMARYDCMGLLWLLKGERVVALTATEAKLSGGLTVYRKRGCE